MHFTTLSTQQRILTHALCLLLLASLVLLPFSSLPQPSAWHEELVPWRVRHWTCQRRYGRRARVCRPVTGWALPLLARLGLMVVLLEWAGWPQHQPARALILGLPLLDLGLRLRAWRDADARRGGRYVRATLRLQEAYRWILLFLFGEGLLLHFTPECSLWPRLGHLALLAGCVKTEEGAWAQGEVLPDGTWRLEMEGHFTLTFKPRDLFEERLLLMFLRQWRTPLSTERQPFLRQAWLAEWFEQDKSNLSRWQKYVRQGGLRKLSGEHDAWVVTPALRQAILDIWLPNFWLSAPDVHARLLATGVISSPEQVSERSIWLVAEETGLAQVRQGVRHLFHLTVDGPQWKDKVLAERLFELNERLMAELAARGGVPVHEQLEVESLRQAAGRVVDAPTRPLPWAYRWQQWLFGQWALNDNPQVRCPHCGCDYVRRKENKPRTKRYRDCRVEGYRYYCLNPACPFGTFTSYPADVALVGPWSMDMMLWGVAVYQHLRTTYRRAAAVVGVSHVTLWRWTSAVGQQALPVAALFGVVRSSGVVGIDEKWVLVPKNDKPAGKRRRWMYVYLAVDVYTYDLLHIDLFPHASPDEARAFLQALHAKGYQPRVIVTDMNQDYSQVIPRVFPHALHHECVFHALQWTQRLIKDVYGPDYAHTHPEAVALKADIYAIFQAKSRKTVHKRYQQVMGLAKTYVTQQPQAQRIFDFLEGHYPRLVNAVENPLVPLTNNAVELVIRRFDQHYQNMCGFDSIGTARRYLYLFELTYRFTPFAKDNRPVKGRQLDIRGKCPLELAGYDISHMPIARILRASLLGWPPDLTPELVPNA
jgi:transposase-like protein